VAPAAPLPPLEAEGEPAAKKPRRSGGPPLLADGGYVEAADGWLAHSGGEWLHNKSEGAYFHLPTGQLRVVLEEAEGSAPVPDSAEAGESADDEGPLLRGRVRWFNAVKGFGFIEPLDPEAAEALGGKDVFVHRNQILGRADAGEGADADAESVFASLEAEAEVTFRLGQTDNGKVCAVKVRQAEEEAAAKDGAEEGSGEEDDADGNASEASSVEIDLLSELKSGATVDKAAGKDKVEDYVVEKLEVPVSVLGETATCVFYGVFDGHGGHNCAEHIANNLAKNFLARLRDRAKGVDDEVALRTAILAGFKQTDHNFLQQARNTDDSSGSTACTMTVFGPDEQMRLRLFMANCGDSRAVLCLAGGTAKRLTEDHKPNMPKERKRIEANEGAVAEIAGIWRAVLPAKKRLSSKIVGLSVSRAFGDKDFKHPDIISAEPEITVHEVDWDGDEFVILATDGIWDVMSDKDAVQLVRKLLQAGSNELTASEALVKRAREKNSKDDCTVMVVRFGWNKASGGAPDAPDAEKSKDAAAQGGKKSKGSYVKEPEEEEDAEGGEEGEEEALDDDEEDEAQALAAMAAAMGANMGAVTGPGGEDDDAPAAATDGAAKKAKAAEDDDLFAADAAETKDVDEEAAGLKRWDASRGETTLDSALFEGLGATQEELAASFAPQGPTVIGGVEGCWSTSP